MLKFLREEWQLVLLILSWVLVAAYLGPVLFVWLPLSVMLLKAREQWAEMIFGFLMVLVLSDVHKLVLPMAGFKGVKNIYIVVLAAFLLLERHRFAPFSRVFNIFLPFFLYSIFPLLFSPDLNMGVQKTLSYALLFLVVPNYVLYNYRMLGWRFFRNLIYFMVAILLAGYLMKVLAPGHEQVGGRFNGLFGNPNGMGIFGFLLFVLLGLLSGIKQDLFSWRERMLLSAIILYFVVISGSRASLAAALIFLLFNRFFAYSPFLGMVGLLAIMGVAEVITRNLVPIIMALGLEEYFRLRTLEEGSGRYFAWDFAWKEIQNYFFFGGGFATDETIMRRHYFYLERMGHQGGVHNSFLSMWFNVGIVGLIIFFRSFGLLFIKAARKVPMSLAAMFGVLFSVMYESWLVGSLNPFTIVLLIIMTVTTEDEIALWHEIAAPEEDGAAVAMELGTPATLPGAAHA